jgi:hypothetical protein
MSSIATAQERVDIIVIGAKKSGSNWMQFTLKSHPQITIPSLERLYLFGSTRDEEAAQIYCNCSLREDQRLTHVKGDYYVTPSAMEDIAAASDRKAGNTGRRILLILCCRHPADRIYSDYAHDLRYGQTTRNFEDWLNSSRGQRAMTLSSYGKAIENWWDPVRLPCLISFTEEFDNPERLQTLAIFLKLSPFTAPPSNTMHNSCKLPRERHLNYWLAQFERITLLPKKLQRLLHRGRERLLIIDRRLPPMKASTRTQLEAAFEPDIRKFESITGLKTPWLP